jgi:hypothetical protein
MRNRISGIKRTLTALVTVCLLTAGLLSWGYQSAVDVIKPNPGFFRDAVELPFDSGYNLVQSYNDCGPYNCAIVVHVLTGKDVVIGDFVRYMEWRLPNKITLPWGLEKLLTRYGIKTTVPFLLFVSRKQRLDYLKAQLSVGRPVILLGLKQGIGHYLTLLGYGDDGFYVYDSWYARNPLLAGGRTYDDNGALPGNLTMSEDEIVNFWRGSENFLFFAWYALVAQYGG